MSRHNIIINDIKLVLNGIQKVLNSDVAIKKSNLESAVSNSNIKNVFKEVPKIPSNVLPNSPKELVDLIQRASMIPHGIHKFATISLQQINTSNVKEEKKGFNYGSFQQKDYSASSDFDNDDEIMIIKEEDLESIYVKTLGAETPHQDEIKEKKEPKRVNSKSNSDQLLEADIDEGQLKSQIKKEVPSFNIKPLSKGKPKSQLDSSSKERKVPASRVGRIVSYGSLAAGLGLGALAEVTKRSIGLGNSGSKSPFLSDANAERIVDTLCKVRGAALKLGQILSLQDDTIISPQLQKIFERVRNAADFMPFWQMEKMLTSEMGSDWKTKIKEFDSKPFAAASIGQVHLGKLHDDRPVAIKIQYPGVAKGINSDIDNLISILNIWNIIPPGIFIDSVIKVAKRELAWEVDYLREAECAKRFIKYLEPYPSYYVPRIIDELTTKQVYTTELIEGIPVDKCFNLDQQTRNEISYLLIDLFFRELFEFRFMQTDPNWSNFLYNPETKQLGLLDFGASREYNKKFVDNYLRILKGGADKDRKTVIDYSKKIGFLTGYESKSMLNAHVDSVFLLAQPFQIGDKEYEFGKQNITLELQRLIPIMVAERLCPPPEEIYSLHRKLSGVFLLCSKLNGRISCKPIVDRIMSEYKFEND